MPGSSPIAITGDTERNVAPIMTGKRAPNPAIPSVWISVAIPAAKSPELIRNAV
jgi:hypothetical protein